MGLKGLLNYFIIAQERSSKGKTKLSIEILSNSSIQMVLKYILSFSKHLFYVLQMKIHF